MNLLDESWLPVRRLSGRCELIQPWALTDGIDIDPIVALDVPRPDFNGSLLQFLIGLIQTAWTPENDIEWEQSYVRPPSTDVLQRACARYRHAFELDGDGPRFLQDLDPLTEKGNVIEIAALLIEEPGEQAKKFGTDLFIKRNRIPHLGIPAAVSALITMQCNAPAGGAGIRTSLRGGGPLTTLMIPDPLHDSLPVNLWRLVWLNVLSATQCVGWSGNASLTDDSAIFPWLADTRVSDKQGVETTPLDAHPFQMYWGMPRRIRFGGIALGASECPLFGTTGPSIRECLTRPLGVHYNGAWRHPLSPHIHSDDGTFHPIHPQPGGIGYPDWLAFNWGDNQGHEPAAVVLATRLSYARRQRATRLWAFGYDMNKMKARGWYETTMPVLHIDSEKRDAFVADAGDLIEAAREIKRNLRHALKEAWFSRDATVRGNLDFVTQAYWQATEQAFYRTLAVLHRHYTTQAPAPDRVTWLHTLGDASLELFDRWAVSGTIEQENPKRIAVARSHLRKSNQGKKLRQRLGLAGRAA